MLSLTINPQKELQYFPIHLKMMNEALEKQIITRVKRIKCQQPQCRSNHLQTLEIAVVGDGNYKKKGIMCTSCFIDQELIQNLGNIELHTLSIQKFLKVLTESYSGYAQEKAKPDWAPSVVEAQKQDIRKKIMQLERVVTKGILDIMKYVQDCIKQASEQAKKANHQKPLQKLLQLISQEDESEQQRLSPTNELKDLTSRIVKDHGEYRLTSEEQVKKQNQVLMVEFRRKVGRARDAVGRLVEVHKKCLKHLIQ